MDIRIDISDIDYATNEEVVEFFEYYGTQLPREKVIWLMNENNIEEAHPNARKIEDVLNKIISLVELSQADKMYDLLSRYGTIYKILEDNGYLKKDRED